MLQQFQHHFGHRLEKRPCCIRMGKTHESMSRGSRLGKENESKRLKKTRTKDDSKRKAERAIWNDFGIKANELGSDNSLSIYYTRQLGRQSPSVSLSVPPHIYLPAGAPESLSIPQCPAPYPTPECGDRSKQSHFLFFLVFTMVHQFPTLGGLLI